MQMQCRWLFQDYASGTGPSLTELQFSSVLVAVVGSRARSGQRCKRSVFNVGCAMGVAWFLIMLYESSLLAG